MIDYLKIIADSRDTQPEHAANVPVFYESRLTAARKRAVISKRKVTRLGKTASGRRTTSSETSMAKKKGTRKRKSGRLTKAEIKKAGGIKQAWKARKGGAKPHKARKARKAAKRPKARKMAAPKPRKTRKTRKTATAAAKPKKSRKGGKKRRASRKVKRAVSMRLPRKARKVYVVAAEKKRRRGRRKTHHTAMTPRKHRRHHRGGGRRRGAMENPLTGVELFIGGITGLTGFAIGDFVDRMLATHALTVKTAAVAANGSTAAVPATYADTPPTTGNYIGLYNPTAITAPMNIVRWVNALAAPAVLFLGAHFVSNPVGRSSMQFFAFGYAMRTVGKGVIDMLAKLTTNLQLGQQVYDGEMRAAALAANNGNGNATALANLPSAGLGKPQLPAPCAKGCGCSKHAASAKPAVAGVGYPSLVREVGATIPNQPRAANPPPAVAPPPPPAAPPIPQQVSTLTGAVAVAGSPVPGFKPFGSYDH